MEDASIENIIKSTTAAAATTTSGLDYEDAAAAAAAAAHLLNYQSSAECHQHRSSSLLPFVPQELNPNTISNDINFDSNETQQQKMKLENEKYEDLMLDLGLLHETTTNKPNNSTTTTTTTNNSATSNQLIAAAVAAAGNNKANLKDVSNNNNDLLSSLQLLSDNLQSTSSTTAAGLRPSLAGLVSGTSILPPTAAAATLTTAPAMMNSDSTVTAAATLNNLLLNQDSSDNKAAAAHSLTGAARMRYWNSFDETTPTFGTPKQESKSGEELLSNMNSLLSSPSLDPFNVMTPLVPSTTMPLLPSTAVTTANSAGLLPNTTDDLTLKLLETLPYGTTTSTKDLNSASLLLDSDLALDYALGAPFGSSESDNKVDMLDVPGKGCCFVYLARYSYDPYQQSLNDNPEYELPLSAGDYVLVWGDADEDGYFDGELLDGRKGLCPSNFLEKLSGEDLLEFHRSVILANHVTGDEEMSTEAPVNLPLDLQTSPEREQMPLNMIYENESHLLNATYLTPEEELPEPVFPVPHSTAATTTYARQTTTDSPTGEVSGSSVPAPKHLTLERQLNKSILISWSPPDSYYSQIEMYHVYVDGFLRTTVKATDKTKALVEGVDSARPHRISVRSVLVNRKTSKDAACTMIIGRDAPLGPSCVKASNVTSSSAVISWLPSNSNFQHTVCINNVEVRTVKAGTFKHSITGLTPNTHYKVTVRAKNIKASPYVDERSLTKLLERLSAHTEFKTLNKALPDPPMDVRVDGGPQDGTLLVTWIPVPTQPAGMPVNKHLAPVTGYAVFADGKRVTDVDSPSSDHALIDLGCIGHFNPKIITVRSKSRELLSQDSPAVAIQGNVKKRQSKAFGDSRYKYGSGMAPGQGSSVHGPGRSRSRSRAIRDASGQLIIEQDEDNLSDKEMYARNVPAIEITRESPSEFDQYSEEDYEMRKRSNYRMGHRRRPGQQHSRVNNNLKDGSRIFVALFDYDPPTMSPNPEACDDELAFREGQLIKIIGEKDADGFYWGTCNGASGYVPCNMVSEVQVDDERFLQDMVMKDDKHRRRSNRFMNRDRWGDIYNTTPLRKMIALYDYDPQELSPNVDAEVELKFHTGDVIYVYGEMDDDGFYLAELRGQRGLVPSNFLTETATDYKKQVKQSTGPLAGLLSGASGPPPPPRDNRIKEQPKQESKPVTSLLGQLTSSITSKKEPQPPPAPEPKYVPPAPVVTNPSGGIDLDRIPGLDDFDEPVPVTTTAAPAMGGGGLGLGLGTTRSNTNIAGNIGGAKLGTGTAAKPGATGQEGEGGLLGAVTGGISGLATGGVSGITGKLGDLTGAAAGAGGGILNSGKGLFKKFGF